MPKETQFLSSVDKKHRLIMKNYILEIWLEFTVHEINLRDYPHPGIPIYQLV